MRVENFCIKLPKGTPLRQIWSKKSFGVYGSYVVLTLYSDEKKVGLRENRHWKIESSITLRRDPRKLALRITMATVTS